MSDRADAADTQAGTGARREGRLRLVLERRAEWIEALIILTTIAAAFVVLGFLARYFQDYFRLILIFFFAWLLAFLIAPVADFLQRRLTQLPRPVAVIAVIVPVILVTVLVLVRVIAAIVDSSTEMAGALPSIAAHPPTFVADLQSWLDQQGIAFDVDAAFRSTVNDLLARLSDVAVAAVGGAFSAVSTMVDAIVVVSLAVFLAIDRDSIIRLGLELTPPEKRDDVLMFRRS